MTSNLQAEAIALLADVWALSPDVRLGQLLAHLGFLGEVHYDHGLGDIEDDEIMAILQRHKAELAIRMQAVSNPAGPPAAGLPLTGTSPLLQGGEPSPS
jgi:hypothetical protein